MSPNKSPCLVVLETVIVCCSAAHSDTDYIPSNPSQQATASQHLQQPTIPDLRPSYSPTSSSYTTTSARPPTHYPPRHQPPPSGDQPFPLSPSSTLSFCTVSSAAQPYISPTFTPATRDTTSSSLANTKTSPCRSSDTPSPMSVNGMQKRC